MSGFFRINGELQRGYGMYFTSISLSRPRASRLLKAFLSVLSNSTDFR